MIKIKVLLFAQAKDLAGCGECKIGMDTPATFQALRKALEKQFPKLTNLLALCRMARNQELAVEMENIILNEDDEIAVLPPVSGG